MSVISDVERAVATGVGFLDRSERIRVNVLGPDRAKFLHNVTTNDVKKLSDGQGVEAFVTSLQGKTLAYVSMLVCDDRIVLRADPHGLDQALPHLQKYGVFDEVSLEDDSSRTFEYHVAGPRAEELLRSSGGTPPDPGEYRHRTTRCAESEVRVVRESPTGHSGLTLIGPRAEAVQVREALQALGAALGMVEIDPATYEVLRIEAGTPVFGRDITAENLPQEVGRDRLAISFVKGCYLGQETVARIDALGHVNKILKGLILHDSVLPPPGSALEIGDKTVGRLTSVAQTPGRDRPVALGYVKVAQARAGTEVQIPINGATLIATVADLPMRPHSG